MADFCNFDDIFEECINLGQYRYEGECEWWGVVGRWNSLNYKVEQCKCHG